VEPGLSTPDQPTMHPFN